jgi:tryptophanyl-tRNA synthetase
MQKEIVVSGIRSTGFLHLGNYFGAIQNYIRMQDAFDCYFFVADLHALTTHPNPKELKPNVYRVIAENIACGLDPEKVALYVQSDVPETNELYLLLNTLAYKGELEKTASFKEKGRANPNNVNAGLLTYPVLMAADILLHKALHVPVGKDQEQHLEMTRTFAQRFNHRYGTEFFPEPHPFNFGAQLVKVPSLDGSGKMSKSENENATIYLTDSDEIILKKCKKAKTDLGPTTANSALSPEMENIFLLLELVSAPDVVAKFKADYANCTVRYGDLKGQLGEDMANFVRPIREKALDLLANEAALQKIMQQGAEKARASARKTVDEVRNLMGINYY